MEDQQDDTPIEEITALLARMERGDAKAANELLPLVYDRLRALAASYFRGQRPGDTLQPTALVHEAFLRMVQSESAVADRAHFMAVAATAMKQILIDRSRRRRAAKRGSEPDRVTLSGVGEPAAESPLDAMVVADLLERLAALDERQARIVELRIFGGLTVEEAAEVLKLSPRTVQKDWRSARAWLARELGRGDPA